MQTIALITDIHLDEDDPKEAGVDSVSNWQRILLDIDARGITHIVFGGDIGAATAYPWFFNSLKKYQLNFILGNHDTFAAAAPFYTGNTPADGIYYTVENDRYKYIFMDTSTEKVSDAQFKWLESELSTGKRIVMFIHHPVLAIDTPVDRAYPLEGRERIEELLQRTGKSIDIFCGHYHVNDVRQVGNIRQTVTPASSYQIIKDAAEIEVSGDTFGYRVINFGERIESKLIMYRANRFVGEGE